VEGYPEFWLLVAAVVAPMLAEIPIGIKVPVAVLEVLLGIALGPHGLDRLHFNGLVAAMFAFGMAATLFMAGMELDWERIRGRPLTLAAGGWVMSVLLVRRDVARVFAALQHLTGSGIPADLPGHRRRRGGHGPWAAILCGCSRS